MRLINTQTLELENFSLATVPPYAILSHTWNEAEVGFHDMSLPSRFQKKGYRKIRKTCELALQNGHKYAWVDTCCIDKSSSAELTESINSMFQWYKDAVICYVFLEDLSPDDNVEIAMKRCRWFTRGWTLQELIAPRLVTFYDMRWQYRGSKLDLMLLITYITGVDKNLLTGQAKLSHYGVACKMSWASQRQTTRVEDTAYCLMGIFDVNMPLIYGEGMKAFRRLQEEIVKRNNDLTILAWEQVLTELSPTSLFAPSPVFFGQSSGIHPFSDSFIDFSVTNKGLLISSDHPLRAVSVYTHNGRQIMGYSIFLGRSLTEGGIFLRKIGPKLFLRDARVPLIGFQNEVTQIGLVDDTQYYIVIDALTAKLTTYNFRKHVIHIPSYDRYLLTDMVPLVLWDVTDRVFLRPKPYKWVGYDMVIGMLFDCMILGELAPLVVLCDYRDENIKFKVFQQGQYLQLEGKLFRGRNRDESIYWSDLEADNPQFNRMNNSLALRIGATIVKVEVSVKKELITSISVDTPVLSLVFKVLESRP